MRYFGRLDLAEGKYYKLLRLDSSKTIGQFYAAASDKWMDSESAFEAPYDTTHYDELTEEHALEIKERMKKEYFRAEVSEGVQGDSDRY